MLFTSASPENQTEGIRLYFQRGDALASEANGEAIRGVAVHYDGLLHRLIPLYASNRESTIPARNLGDGSVLAHGPIPSSLFLESRVHSAATG